MDAAAPADGKWVRCAGRSTPPGEGYPPLQEPSPNPVILSTDLRCQYGSRWNGGKVVRGLLLVAAWVVRRYSGLKSW